MVKANSLTDLTEISKVDLPYENDYGYVRGGIAIAEDVVG